MTESKAGWTKPFIGAALLMAVAVGVKLYGPEWDNEALVALTNISFRTYSWLGWPTYTISCIVFVGLDDAAAS